MMEIILSVIACTAAMRLTYKVFFADSDDLIDCIKYWLTPDIVAIFRGEWDRQWWAEMRLFLWILIGAISAYAVYQFLIS